MEANNQNLDGQAAQAAQPQPIETAVDQVADLIKELEQIPAAEVAADPAALFLDYANIAQIIDQIKKENNLPALEKQADAIKEKIQKFAKENGECEGAGYVCTLSTRPSWDTKALDGFAAAYPEILKLRSETTVATVKRAKAGKS